MIGKGRTYGKGELLKVENVVVRFKRPVELRKLALHELGVHLTDRKTEFIHDRV